MPTTTASAKQLESEAIVNRYLPWSLGAGLIPVPVVDVAALTGVQLKMISEISRVYGIEFSETSGKSIIASLIGSVGASTVASGTLGSLVKAIPGFGPILGAVTFPLVAGATTYAVGKVFIQHFESGGTFLSFDSVEGKKIFAEKFAEGKDKITQMARNVDAKVSASVSKVVDF